ncbi:3-deoxy-D-manno-octulosonate 8-phosphate phosphatase [[Haemophilus] ducreyi]|uniref:KdsC family phosphatase n=1 Tax=Haemophilus ducreyi TaxID=730 RepID=UPI0006552728|nr:HAD-IIIA family hydrolase [[Haemophilus] ducreyi]AKO36170.1 3-deoxy-D-manno-octulosonate 8-phosphate phosphatase [[Haemophilus] ducreyi]AKO37624.1 3-deoxy-D-manno-octulosonate 8-phosphate phosphatase [[Haemophilus] ducreyi]AKO40670.1 3-deoxy-D-manno-octulosonate 8-phosphate phosphatase [[Haemophilus] ducreyi]AKO42123.1 3-deoxy-D-manno-octulosonate 8-phosphate phosphatase [[Haemophilus] ducreyi]ANF70013.1 3-deoxy-D-manno-octulosonate 8-phosphate phosphatase [[Haemophilus] ducreyi]
MDLSKIKLVITDVDGVLTDGGLYYTTEGEIMKRFHVHDGLGIKMLQACGIQVAILSGGDSTLLRKRIEVLKVSLFQLGKMEKRSACFELMQQACVMPEQTAFIGDDTLDLPAFQVCGLAIATHNAHDYIKKQADWILTKAGGEGAFREVSDRILEAQGFADIFNSAEGFLTITEKMAQ